jgi:hypothetical protein
MNSTTPITYTAFAGNSRIATGPLADVAAQVKARFDANETAPLLIFDDQESRQIDFDWSQSLQGILSGLVIDVSKHSLKEEEKSGAPRGPGRPKLGVVAREVTLLPRHWDWLAGQPGGASVALRKLVEAARKQGADADRLRLAREAAYRFMSAMAGNQPGYEEATRALFAGDRARFEQQVALWPAEVRDYAVRLAFGAEFPAGDTPAAQSQGAAP